MTKPHDPQLKQDVLQLLQDGTATKEISALTGVPLSTVYRWKAEQQAEATSVSAVPAQQLQLRVKELEEALAQTQAELQATSLKLLEIYTWAARKIQGEQKAREQAQAENPPGPQFKSRPQTAES